MACQLALTACCQSCTLQRRGAAAWSSTSGRPPSRRQTSSTAASATHSRCAIRSLVKTTWQPVHAAMGGMPMLNSMLTSCTHTYHDLSTVPTVVGASDSDWVCVPDGASYMSLPTVQVDKAVVDALASALETSPEAGSAALRAAVRRHAIVDVQV